MLFAKYKIMVFEIVIFLIYFEDPTNSIYNIAAPFVTGSNVKKIFAIYILEKLRIFQWAFTLLATVS